MALTKDAVTKFCIETKEFAAKWFNGKDDDWLKLRSTRSPTVGRHTEIDWAIIKKNDDELRLYKKQAKEDLALTEEQINQWLRAKTLIEIEQGEENAIQK